LVQKIRMAYLISLALIFSISLAVTCNQFEKSLDVLSLNSSNFDESLKTYDYLLVFFYTPSSHQARKLFNEYSRAATHFKEDHSKNVAFAKVDASIEKDLAKRFNIVGFPAIDFFIQGVSVPFKGGRSKDSIVDWLDKKIQTQAVLVKKLDTLTELQSENDVVVLGLFKNVEQDGHAEFNKVVKAVDNIKFAVTYEKSIFEKLNLKNEKSLIIFKNFDEGRNVYDESEPFEADKIKKFINSNQYV
jgi:protein disulfide-isomerase A1